MPPTTPKGRKQGAGSDSRPPVCRAPDARSLLLPYALSTCREAEAIRFEAHLLACESCFQDLKALDRASTLIREFIDSASPVLDRVRQALLEAHSAKRRSAKGHTPRAENPGGAASHSRSR